MAYINIIRWNTLFLCALVLSTFLYCNESSGQSFHQSDTLNHKRVRTAFVVGGLAYTTAGVWMYKSWYEMSERSSLHSFNDWKEWRNMDKYGHAATTQYQSYLAYRGARWCGYDERKAARLGAGTALLLQTTVEVMDGFSADWGFSWWDMAFNVAGAGVFIGQQRIWNDQRIRFKMSARIKKYPTEMIPSINESGFSSESRRADDLFGDTFYERLLKDYNEQTYWISFNLSSFLPKTNLPPWLNFAMGIGAKNMYGGFDNSWHEGPNEFRVDKKRMDQFFLAPDVDWTKIHTESRVLRTVFDLLSVVKFPAPGLEWNKTNGIELRWVAW